MTQYNNEMEVNSDDLLCIICTYALEGQPFCRINNAHEHGKYHVECFEQWISRSNHGVLTQFPIQSYSIYHDNSLIETLIVPEIIPQINNIENDTIYSEEDHFIDNDNMDKNCCCILF